jgi:hypothetical protein
VRNDKPQPYVQQVLREPAGTRVVHTPVQVLAQGLTDGGDSTVTALLTGIANNSILISGRAGFIQENTAITLPGETAAATLPATKP